MLDFITNTFGTTPIFEITGIIFIILGGYVGSRFDILWSKRPDWFRLPHKPSWLSWATAAKPFVWIWKFFKRQGGKIMKKIFKKPPSFESIKMEGQVGFYIGPVTWNYLFRPVISLLAGFFLAEALYLILWIPILTGWVDVHPLDQWVTLLLGVALSLYFGQDEKNADGEVVPELVPGTKMGALVTFFDAPLPLGGLYRKSGSYPWTGKRLKLDRSRKVSKQQFGTDGDGFINLGKFQFPIWNSSQEEDKTNIRMIADNDAHVFGSLTLDAVVSNPRLLLDAENPALLAGDASRQRFREIIATLNDTDVPQVERILERLFRGAPFISIFLPKTVGRFKAGSMIRDVNGAAMFKLIEVKEGESLTEARERTLQEFKEDMRERVDTTMLRAVGKKPRNPDGTFRSGQLEYIFRVIDSSTMVSEVLGSIGIKLEKPIFGDIDLSDAVIKAANAASAEANERTGQLASAETMKKVREKLLPSNKEWGNPGYVLATMVAAAQDDKTGSIRVVYTPDGNQFTQAAVAGASQIGGNSK